MIVIVIILMVIIIFLLACICGSLLAINENLRLFIVNNVDAHKKLIAATVAVAND